MNPGTNLRTMAGATYAPKPHLGVTSSITFRRTRIAHRACGRVCVAPPLGVSSVGGEPPPQRNLATWSRVTTSSCGVGMGLSTSLMNVGRLSQCTMWAPDSSVVTRHRIKSPIRSSELFVISLAPEGPVALQRRWSRDSFGRKRCRYHSRQFPSPRSWDERHHRASEWPHLGGSPYPP